MFPRIPTWALGVTVVVLGLGVIPIAAFESWRQTVFTRVGAAPTITLLAAMAFLAFGAICFHRHKIKAMDRALEDMRTRLAAAAAAEDAPCAPLDYIGAGAIVDRYIEPAVRDKPDGVRLTVRKDFLDRFDKVTGAKLGEYEYNRALLHQWMQENAARFLVENREKML